MRTNLKPKPDSNLLTHEGAPAKRIDAEAQLRRSVMACLLWEKEFYEEGEDIAMRIASLVLQVSAVVAHKIAVEARTKMKLRHVPLLIAREMAAHHKSLTASTLLGIIQRVDEIPEFLSLYWKDGRTPISAQVKKGLALAFVKFNEYEFAKYDRDSAVKLRDVLFLVHGRTKDTVSGFEDRREGHEHTYPLKIAFNEPITKKSYKRGKVRRHLASLAEKIVQRTLATPDTWEVRITAAKTKEERAAIWTDLITRKRLGALALLRNLRNMREDGVPVGHVKAALAVMDVERVLPFRFISAARHAPEIEPELEAAMFRALAVAEKLPGKTALVIDNSGSMDAKLSGKSDLTRRDAACALAILLREVCEDVVIFAFSENAVCVPARRGMALAEAISRATNHGSTNTETALQRARAEGPGRLIVVTDEQSHQQISGPGGGAKGYFVNVASAMNGIGYGAWQHIDGFSESIVTYIQEAERAEPNPQR